MLIEQICDKWLALLSYRDLELFNYLKVIKTFFFFFSIIIGPWLRFKLQETASRMQTRAR